MKILCKYLTSNSCVAWTTVCLFWTISNSDAFSYKNFYRMIKKPVTFREKDVLRIFDGDPTGPDEFPYIVIIGLADLKPREKLYRGCTGTLITKTWVITAAHCIVDKHQKPIESELRVYYGNLTVGPRKTTEYARVLDKIPHPNYCQWRYVNDVGLLVIDSTPIKTFASMSAVDYLSLPGFPVTYVGGGLTIEDGLVAKKPREAIMGMVRDQFRPLKKAEAVVVPCDRDDPPLLICLRSKCSRRSQIINPGDSGGPLFYRGKIVGVACCKGVDLKDKHLFYYTSLSPFMDWIHDTIRKEYNVMPENEIFRHNTTDSFSRDNKTKNSDPQRTKSPST